MPGDFCTGGVDLGPSVVSCGYGGLLFGFLTAKTAILFLIVGALLYYGRKYLEALLIALPIPDPKDMKEKMGNMIAKGKGAF